MPSRFSCLGGLGPQARVHGDDPDRFADRRENEEEEGDVRNFLPRADERQDGDDERGDVTDEAKNGGVLEARAAKKDEHPGFLDDGHENEEEEAVVRSFLRDADGRQEDGREHGDGTDEARSEDV